MRRVCVIVVGVLLIVAGCAGDDDDDTLRAETGHEEPEVTEANAAPARVDEPDFEEIDEPLYDPDVWFEVNARGGSYLCTRSYRYRGFDCQRWYGDRVDYASVVNVDLYCSGSESYPECSVSWYPDELAKYEFVRFGGQEYVCDSTSYDPEFDWECSAYDGGNPEFASRYDQIMCTGRYEPDECVAT